MVQLKGNGNIVSKVYPVSSFLRLHVAVRGEVELIQGEEEKLEVEMDENLLDHFSAMNHGRTLFVSAEDGLRSLVFTHSKVRIYLRQLDTLVIRCSGGNVTCPGGLRCVDPLELKVQSEGSVNLRLAAPGLKALFQSVGDIQLSGEVGVVEIKYQGQGNLMARDLHAKELNLRNSGVGNLEVYASEQITIAHSGVGWIHYFGEGRLKDVKQYGQGEVCRG